MRLWWIEHLLSEMLIRTPDIVGLYTVLKPLDLTVKVAQNGLDWCGRPKRCPVCETHILV